MAAFDRISSGIRDLDAALDNIRLGDNVVLRVSDLDEFHLFLDPFVARCRKDGRKLVYVRFASHPPLVAEEAGVETVHVELSHRFETFTVAIHQLIRERGREVFYVFDCLSELQTIWATDMMMSNFFRVTCPFLFEMDTVAYFPILRGRHSFQAIANIRDTAQVFLDVFSDREPEEEGEERSCLRGAYLRPQKVWNRYSDTMFLPHFLDARTGSLSPVLDGVQASRFYSVMNRCLKAEQNQNTDAWDRFFNDTKARSERGEDVTDACARMCRIMMTRDEHLRALIRENFAPQDYFRVRDHMIGTGMIGGKACGMLLARKIIENRRPDLYCRFEPHDSYYIGSDVFYSYIVENGYWNLRVRQRSEEEYFSLAERFAEALRRGSFPREMEEQFVQLLEYYGQDPIIVRSSSILEDGYGNAFAGKYESVFLSNTGSMEERLLAFKDAVRTVYASTMSLSALDYRKRRGLAKRDEQMALLVQRVSGSHYGRYYLPCAAGVGYSYSPYRFLREMDPAAGMLRLVMGLGTMAVDRVEGSYPRIVSLDRPEVTAAVTEEDRHRFSQRKIAVVDAKTRSVRDVFLEELLPVLADYLKKTLLTHDREAERFFRESGRPREVYFITCGGLVKKEQLMKDMRDLLAILEAAYGNPLDTEFTINLSPTGEYMINLLQCRPLQLAKDTGEVKLPEKVPEEDIVLKTQGVSMGLSRRFAVDLLVFVDPVKYYLLPYAEKPAVRDVIHRVNWRLRGKGVRMVLLVPGRIGTSSPELGVPTVFSDISEFDVVVEIASSRAGYNPELSYGSHFFQDLVEAGIGYTAVFEDAHTVSYHPERLLRLKDVTTDYLPEGRDRNTGAVAAVSVLDARGSGLCLYTDINSDVTLVVYSGEKA